ncbi:MAG TPA: nucleoside permease [Vicinamibacteria bacterium]|nr:nucleoside permease [Vicinamibacteria bacterium]
MSLPASVRLRLSAMMFLQFFIWGAWFVTLSTYLGQGLKFGGTDIGNAYSTMPWGAIVAPFLVGMIADRFFAAEKVLGVLHLAGAVLLWEASQVSSPGAVFWVLLAYALCYNPTLALVNAVSFNQMKSPEKQFPAVRVFGTVGWIVAGLIVGALGLEATAAPLRIAAGCSALLGLFSFALPHTPPKSLGHRVTVRDVLGLDALVLMKDRSFAVFVIGSLLICIPLAFYYGFANLFLNEMGVANAAGKMTMGQMSEVFFMLVMPFFFVRLGVKKMLIVGMLAWAARYLLFAFGDPGALVFMYYLGILLHGICYDFFFVTGQIYVDNTAPKKIQASAQGFITLITYGVGMLIGTQIAGWVVQGREVTDTAGAIVGHDWQGIWLVPAGMAFLVLALFAALFRERGATPAPAAARAAAAS